MIYKAFYYSASLNRDVAADVAESMNLDVFCSDVIKSVKEKDDFCGLIDSNGNTLQTIYEEEIEAYWVEVPRPDLNGSYGMHMPFDCMLSLFQSLNGDDFPLEGFAHFEFSEW